MQKDFDGDEYLKCIKELVKLDKSWIPREHGYSLYIRPTLISTAVNHLLKFFVMLTLLLFSLILELDHLQMSNFIQYCAPSVLTTPKDSNLYGFLLILYTLERGLVDQEHLNLERKFSYFDPVFNFAERNYAPTILPQKQALQKGYAQILWLLGKEGYVTEVGTMNQFFFWKNTYGDLELVTAPLDGTILPGITRDSILTLARSWGEFKVSERKFTIQEVIDAVESGRVSPSLYFDLGT